MSSDAFADLGGSALKVADGLLRLLGTCGRPASGSPADKESDGEPWAAEWSAHPARDLIATVLMQSWSCADHMKAIGHALSRRETIASLYTLTRGGAEAASILCYLSASAIDPLERVRRLMNYNLAALQEDRAMLAPFSGDDAGRKAARHLEKEQAIARSAQQYGLAFKKSSKPYVASHVGEQQPSAMKLIDQCASRTPGVGATSYRLLSSVAHGQMHGLSRFLLRAPVPAEPGKVVTQMSLSAHDAALHLLAGPLCVSTVVEDLRWYFGWDTEALDPAVTAMLYTWGRIAGAPYPGPEVTASPPARQG